MCDLCALGVSETTDIAGGFSFVKAKQSDIRLNIKQGQWVLFSGAAALTPIIPEPYPDPVHDLSDAEIEALNQEDTDDMFQWLRDAEMFQQKLLLPPRLGHDLVEACKNLGYDPVTSGFLGHWLFHHIGEKIRAQKPESEA